MEEYEFEIKYTKVVGMIRKYPIHTLQTSPLHREEKLTVTRPRKTINVKQRALSSPSRWFQN